MAGRSRTTSPRRSGPRVSKRLRRTARSSGVAGRPSLRVNWWRMGCRPCWRPFSWMFSMYSLAASKAPLLLPSCGACRFFAERVDFRGRGEFFASDDASRAVATAGGSARRPPGLRPWVQTRQGLRPCAQTCFLTSGETKAQEHVAVARRARVAVRRADEPRDAVPRATAGHPARARGRPSRVDSLLRTILAEPVRAPLQHVPQHVEQPPWIRLFEPDRMGSALRLLVLLLLPELPCYVVSVVQIEIDAAVAAVPGDRIEERRIVFSKDLEIPKPGGLCRSRPTSTLPLCLGGQPRAEPVHSARKLRQEDLAIVPAHVLHRPLRAHEPAWIAAHHRLPEGLCTRRVGQPIATAQHHLVLRSLVFPAPGLGLRRPHREGSRRYPPHALDHAIDSEPLEYAVSVLAPLGGPWLRQAIRQRGETRFSAKLQACHHAARHHAACHRPLPKR